MNEYPKVFKNKYGKVSVYHYVQNGKWSSYKIIWRLGKKSFQERRPTAELADERAKEILEQLSQGEEVLSRMDKEKIAYYVTCEQMLAGRITMMELIRRYLKEDEKITSSADLMDCISKYMASMKARGLSRAHMEPVKSRLLKFSRAMPENLFAITVAKANEYLEGIENLTTRFNERVVLIRFFTWCRDNGILPRGNKHVLELTDVPNKKWKEPEIIKPDDLAKVLWNAKNIYPEIVVPVALGAFAGLRRAEIERLRPSDIDLARGIITISADVTKTNQRRIITISDTLQAWLEDFLPGTQSFSDVSYKYKILRCVRHVGAFWPTNGLRHSYVSYRVQADRDMKAVAHECGHSIEVLQRHYRCLCTPEAAEKWFDILPETTNFGLSNSGVTVDDKPIDSE